jgi:hypothetical protein
MRANGWRRRGRRADAGAGAIIVAFGGRQSKVIKVIKRRDRYLITFGWLRPIERFIGCWYEALSHQLSAFSQRQITTKTPRENTFHSLYSSTGIGGWGSRLRDWRILAQDGAIGRILSETDG